MSRIIECYTKFFNAIPLNNNDSVDMTSLFEQCNGCTPIQLKYDNEPESIANLSAVAVRNICQTYINEKRFLKDAVNDLSKIVIGTENEHVIAQRILLIHYSKRKTDLGRLRIMLMHTCDMRVKDIVDTDESRWIELSYKVVSHMQINAIIDEAISQFGLLPICRVAEPHVEIRLVESSIPALRGFVGLNQIFIHSDNFANRIKAYKGSLRLLQQVAKMDIIAVTIHELAHLKMRRITNDLNSHTPNMAALANLPPSPKGEIEFGVYVEQIVFGKHVDWFASVHTLKQKGKEFVNQLIESVENETPLPKGDAAVEFVERENILNAISGLDIEVISEIC